jgi:hypothetical protein
MVGSRLRVDVPVSSAPKSSAASPTPTAVLRPSSATAIPMKPMFETCTSSTPSRELPAENVEGAGKAGKRPRDRHRDDEVCGRR